jgi:Peptidase S46
MLVDKKRTTSLVGGLLLVLLTALCSNAQGGMWLPLDLKKNNEKEMKSLGLKMKADQIYHPDNASIKDAICQFNGGCTGEIISAQGLLLTNHHCGFDEIQSHSTLENNYVDNGFWAATMKDELPCPDATAMFVQRMEDVTIPVLRGVTAEMGERDRQSAIDQNMKTLRANTRLKAGEEILIRPFYEGNKYYMFITITYKDVRLVGAPPSSIGKFGADTDNWVWPRHTGDFSLFRVYMSPDSQATTYSERNIPLAPRHFLPISIKGLEEGDFTMVYGFPGRTTEYLPSVAVQQISEVLNPARVGIRDKALKIMDGYMRQDPGIKIAYVAKQSSIANAWKKWLGEMQGLKTYKAYEKKKMFETEFQNRVKNNVDLNYKYGNLLERFEVQYKNIEPFSRARDYYLEVFVRNCEVMATAAGLSSWLDSYAKSGTPAFAGKIATTRNQLKGFYKDYRPEVDKDVFAGLIEIYAKNVPADWGANTVNNTVNAKGGFKSFADDVFQNSYLTDEKRMMALLEKSPGDIVAALEKDPAVVFWRAVTKDYEANVAPKVREIQPVITSMQRQYMAAQMEVFKEKRFFPDANSTLRLTYGQVRGFRPKDAVIYDYRTYLDGVMEKYIPGDYEFDVPKKLIELHKNKDYGQYAAKDGRMPVAFLGSNHTTGGNSGSPALDAKGNLVGLNFDRVWEGTMSDVNYDPAICRNIMVDIRYVLFIIDKYAGAQRLINEMKIIR